MTVTICLFIFDALIEKINSMEILLVREGLLEIMKNLANGDACEHLEVYSAQKKTYKPKYNIGY